MIKFKNKVYLILIVTNPINNQEKIQKISYIQHPKRIKPKQA